MSSDGHQGACVCLQHIYMSQVHRPRLVLPFPPFLWFGVVVSWFTLDSIFGRDVSVCKLRRGVTSREDSDATTACGIRAHLPDTAPQYLPQKAVAHSSAAAVTQLPGPPQAAHGDQGNPVAQML